MLLVFRYLSFIGVEAKISLGPLSCMCYFQTLGLIHQTSRKRDVLIVTANMFITKIILTEHASEQASGYIYTVDHGR